MALLQDIGESKTAFWAQVRHKDGSLLSTYLDTINERLAYTAISNFAVSSNGGYTVDCAHVKAPIRICK